MANNYLTNEELEDMINRPITKHVVFSARLTIPTVIQERIRFRIEHILREKADMSKIGRYFSSSLDTVQVNVFCDEPTHLITISEVKSKFTVCSFHLMELPSCCGVLISYTTFVNELFRGIGIAQFLQKMKEDIAAYNGYTAIILSTIEHNVEETHVLEKTDWQKMYSFRNRRSDNKLGLYVKYIHPVRNPDNCMTVIYSGVCKHCGKITYDTLYYLKVYGDGICSWCGKNIKLSDPAERVIEPPVVEPKPVKRTRKPKPTPE